MSDITISELANATGLSAADERKDANLVRRAGSDNGGDWVNANHRIYINAVVGDEGKVSCSEIVLSEIVPERMPSFWYNARDPCGL